MRLPTAKKIAPVGRFVDRLVARFRGLPEIKPILPPPGKVATVRHAKPGSTPRYIRRHWQQAGMTAVMGRLQIGDRPAGRKGRKARARIIRDMVERFAVSKLRTLPPLRVADRKKAA